MGRVLGWLAHALDTVFGKRCDRCRMRVRDGERALHERDCT